MRKREKRGCREEETGCGEEKKGGAEKKKKVYREEKVYSWATVLLVMRFYGCITCFTKHIMGLQVEIQDFESEAIR